MQGALCLSKAVILCDRGNCSRQRSVCLCRLLDGRLAFSGPVFCCLQAPAGSKKAKRKGQSVRYTTLKPASEKPNGTTQLDQETAEAAAGSRAALSVEQSSSTTQVLAL